MMLRTGLIIIVILTAIVYFASSGMQQPPPVPSAPVSQIASPPPVRPGDQFRILKTSWQAGGFGTVGIFDFVLENGNSFTAKDPVISCRFYAESGTPLGSAMQTVFQSFPPKSKKTISKFSMGFVHSQAKSVSCSVIRAEL